jgi:hypothetical protein
MRSPAKVAFAIGFIGAMAIGGTAPVKADGFYFKAPGIHIGVGGHRLYYGRPRYYDYSPGYGPGYYGYGNGCPPNYTVQSGVCKPYRGY